MTIKITTPNGGSDSLDFGCAQTDIVATVTGTEVSSGEGKLELKTTTGGTSATKATVLANGNVGINNVSPTGKLDVVGGRSYFAANSDAFATYLRYNNSTAGCFVGSPAANEFQVSASSGAARMRITSTGNAGIGVTDPAKKLAVGGNVEIRNDDSDGYIWYHDPGTGSFAAGIDYSAGADYVISSGSDLSNPCLTIDRGTKVVTLAEPLPAASGGTGGTSGAGKVLQVLQAVKSDAFSTTSTSLVDVSGLSVTITPVSTSSKILVTVDLFISSSHFVSHAQLLRGTTQLYKGNAAGNRSRDTITFSQNDSGDGIMQRSSATFLDSPSTTSATTYKVQASQRRDGGHTCYINRTEQDRNNVAYDPRGASSITVMEIAG